MGVAGVRPGEHGCGVITDALLDAALAVWNFAVGLLPTGHLALPSPDGLADVLGGLDSMVPILAPIQLGLTILAAVLVFITVRVILVVWNIVYP